MVRGLGAALRLRGARLAAALWRFHNLQLAERALAGRAEPLVMVRRFAGFDLRVDVARSATHRLLYIQGTRFVAERGLVARLVRPGMTAVDVGANIGYYLLLIRRLLGPTGSVICLEPEPTNAEELRANVALNRFRNVTVVEAAAGEREEPVEFTLGLNGRVGARGAERTVRVPQVRLDRFVRERVDFLKIDVEGYEGPVLAGAEGILARWRPNLLLEVHPALMTEGAAIADVIARVRRHYGSVSCHAPVQLGRSAARGPNPLREVYYRYVRTTPVQGLPLDLDALAGRAALGDAGAFWLVATADRRV